ncbi:hypothetical protein HZC31_08620 [Candidatus Woesearchaeota archaeon]|nr:hypothetical protein [Candidatus Woesearchaeota archaeon]
MQINETENIQVETEKNLDQQDKTPSGAVGDTILSASAPAWALTLQFFTIAGKIPFDLFILTRNSVVGKVSELYYFQETAETAFFRWIVRYENGER